MTDFGTMDCEGSGSAAIGGGTLVVVNELFWQAIAITSPRIRVLDASGVKRLMYAGRIGLSYSAPDLLSSANGDWVTWETHVNMVLVDLVNVFPRNGVYADSLWWRLPNGITLRVGGSYA